MPDADSPASQSNVTAGLGRKVVQHAHKGCKCLVAATALVAAFAVGDRVTAVAPQGRRPATNSRRIKRLLVSGLALALVTGEAMAQAAAPPPLGAPAPGRAAPPAGGPNVSIDDDGRGPDGPGRPGGPGHRPMPPPRAAHFRIERGDMAIDIQCADDEPMKACADLTLELLDRLRSMGPAPAMPPATKS